MRTLLIFQIFWYLFESIDMCCIEHIDRSKNIIFFGIINKCLFLNNKRVFFLNKRRNIITYKKDIRLETLKMDDFCEVDLDEFCYKQFDEKNKSCSYIPYDKEKFVIKVNELIKERKIKVLPGYADFCKHIFIENFTEATVETMEINNKNRDLIKTDYISRRDNELPVLVRWLCKKDIKDQITKAKYLDLILYSKDQIDKENKEMKNKPKNISHCDYSIICIKAQNENYELPMTPITMLRNTLITEGGSGVHLNREKYLDSVKYWRHHVSIIDN
ncbi:flagellar associated protein [Plasmodium falciparum IGH-CR14]|uniref:Flagellar associated protein n=1 Tax=Plasmodium falciparum IGH-CR14 TaxID=580059 RepID=A0A0L1IBX7_PLAFA|nr:flagellar associated protein [Plasmodium falciparum IGH-CR14]